jgi:hypothetical protein
MQRKTSRYRNLYALNVILHSLRKHRLPQHLVYEAFINADARVTELRANRGNLVV